jgi:hypothetical protein
MASRLLMGYLPELMWVTVDLAQVGSVSRL